MNTVVMSRGHRPHPWSMWEVEARVATLIENCSPEDGTLVDISPVLLVRCRRTRR